VTSEAIPARFRPQLVEFRAKHGVPALGGAVVGRDGSLELDVVGVRIRGGEDPVQPGDRWHIGSCCKAITAALYARLVERGEAEWGASLADLFPDLAATIDPGWKAITIDDVFVSQAGLPANLGRREMLAAWKDERPITEQRTEAAAAALARPPRRPGRFLYSNLGYIVVGAAIERISGLPFESAVATHVLEPLGIASGGFGPPPDLWGHGGRMLALGPLGLIDLGGGKPADPEHGKSDNPAVMSPAGRLHLTLEDWAKFQRVFLTQGGGFLGAQTVERLLTPAMGPGQRHGMGWAPAHGFGDASFGQQGSNAYWVATALIDRAREHTAMVVANEGRARLLKDTPALALQLLSGTSLAG
jgi:CubicO group peptidase (beta-lactamase class C family)